MKKNSSKIKYYLDGRGQFVIENYNHSRPFANFFPGIAGKFGIPMWVFYVNRGQCISSFGIKDKDQSILEFFPANKSWQFVSTHGFRTFISLKTPKGSVYYEPFQNGCANLKYRICNSMRIGSSHLVLEEKNETLGIKTRVECFNIPNDTYAGLGRVVSVENASGKPISLQLVDGLPQIVPFGTHNFFLKKLGRTIEAWMNVENLKRRAPFYKLAVDPADRPEVVHIEGGNFYLGFYFKSGKAELIKPIVDPEAVFGPVTDFSYPAGFLTKKSFSYPSKQIIGSKTPSAMLFMNMRLAPKETKTFYSLTGQARNIETLNNSIARITKAGYMEKKLDENIGLIRKLKNNILTDSGSREFDLYAGQTYLDNIMRGGYPETLASKRLFYLYSRKHGDLERDYNKFQLQPNYLSQGNGNYRDINQNRRNDCWFNPEVKDENVIFFMNLIQADGFNPLVVKPDSFLLEEGVDLNKILAGTAAKNDIGKLGAYLKKSFTPGELIFFVEENRVRLNSSYEEFLDLILSFSKKTQEAEHGEGFWTDHWTYNLDLIDSYLGIYPEKFNEIFFEKKVFSFFDNAEFVRPRSERYMLYNGKVRQLHCLALDIAKKEMLQKRKHAPHLLRTDHGKGNVYYTTLIAKLLCLAANKLSSLDPSGTGIEMEAGKPNWFDSLNGLPALFGSSTCETFELKRLLKMIRHALEECKESEIELAEEIANFIKQLNSLLDEEDFAYWDKSNSLKEGYRSGTRMGFSGNSARLQAKELLSFVDAALRKVERGLNQALDKTKGTYNAYFINEVTEFDTIDGHYIKPRKFSRHPAPLFLEGQMHALRLSDNLKEACRIHKSTRKSPLFDKKLNMYKVTASLKSMPEEIGRCRIFFPGWLENESIWLHMEYKYILEMLKKGLVDEFYADFKNVLIPFLNPERYGRSILENSSFLVSSAFPDPKMHGNGFVARLSGSTAEFLHIWLVMNTGNAPFRLDEANRLNLVFNPLLPGWLFNRKGEYSFNFLGSVKVTYHNHARKDTFGKNSPKISRMTLIENGSSTEINSSRIPAPYAQKVRSRKIDRIDIYLE
ncbi:MAG: cellobiose phosphorylase [Candidatus Omnitrophica bacterium]|nr:cellobiose phosphorylase [Candidatus Omnitrophota bacterium]MDD5770695.1 cellobiose phosphorylase [Candidatus Omnitrophota bacterium]